MNIEGCRRKQSCCIFMYNPSTCLVGHKETMTNISQDTLEVFSAIRHIKVVRKQCFRETCSISERSQVLMATSMKMAVIWDIANYHPDGRGSKFLTNISQYLPDYMVQHPRISDVLLFSLCHLG
jgi:hypothetical protein